MKHLKPKEEFVFQDPDLSILDTFPNPGISEVTFQCTEFTSLCPITGQPDYGVVRITYTPKELCLESKSLKLYLGAFRQYGGFAEQIAKKIHDDLVVVLKPNIIDVAVKFNSRGGITIEVHNWK